MLHFSPLGDRAVTITLGASIDEAVHRRVRAATARLDRDPPPGLVDRVPAFASLAVHYDPVVFEHSGTTPYNAMVGRLTALLAELGDEPLPSPNTIEIPVCYGGELGPDLEDVAQQRGLAPEEVVRRHTAADYLVFMIGFMPGFAYLGGLDDTIASPRRQTPRTEVPSGSVGIGGSQTGVYPMICPGGWNLIGRTPVAMFDITREEPALLSAGDRVRFREMTVDEYRAWPA